MNIEKDIQHAAKIRRLNDRLRCHGIGQGSVLITSGIQDQGIHPVSTAKDRFSVEAAAAFVFLA